MSQVNCAHKSEVHSEVMVALGGTVSRLVTIMAENRQKYSGGGCLTPTFSNPVFDLAWIRWLPAPSSLFIFLLLEGIPAKYKSSYGDSELGNYSRAPRILFRLYWKLIRISLSHIHRITLGWIVRSSIYSPLRKFAPANLFHRTNFYR